MSNLEPKWIRTDYEDPETGESFYQLEAVVKGVKRGTKEMLTIFMSILGEEAEIMDNEALHVCKDVLVKEGLKRLSEQNYTLAYP